MRLLLPGLAFAAAISSAAADEATIQCLQTNLEIAKVSLDRDSSYGTRYFTFSLHNKLPFAVAGLYIRTVVKSAGRTVPWVDDTMSFDIAGGVEPGETRTIKGFGLSMVPPDTPKDATLVITVLDAADPEKHPIDGTVRFLDWSPDRSQLGCH